MRGLFAIGFLAAALVSGAAAAPDGEALAPEAPAAAPPRVALETTMGRIVVELYPDKAPKTVESFLGYVESGFYDGTIFHRVKLQYLIQGGGYTRDLEAKPTRDPIPNEADNGLVNDRGTIAMARLYEPDSATSQFYINTVDNPSLNHRAKTHAGWGFAVFGRVVEGMDVVDAISAVTVRRTPVHADLPAEPVVVTRARAEQPEPGATR